MLGVSPNPFYGLVIVLAEMVTAGTLMTKKIVVRDILLNSYPNPKRLGHIGRRGRHGIFGRLGTFGPPRAALGKEAILATLGTWKALGMEICLPTTMFVGKQIVISIAGNRERR